MGRQGQVANGRGVRSVGSWGEACRFYFDMGLRLDTSGLGVWCGAE